MRRLVPHFVSRLTAPVLRAIIPFWGCFPTPYSLLPTPYSLPMQFPLLITGVAGVIGYNALDYFLTRYPGEVVGVRQGTRGDIAPAPGVVFADVDNANELERLFEKYQFKSVIHSGGSCALKACQLNPELAWTLNLSTILSMLAQCERYNSRLICMSVDLVYKGRPAGEFYKETDPPDAVSIYGQSMSAAENLILLHRPQTCILRISLPMGKSGTGHAGAIDWIGSRFLANRQATLFTDELRTPTYCQDINRVLEEILNRDEAEFSGVFHCGQPRPVSLYQCAQIINRVGGFAPDLLYGLKTNEGAPIPPRATNVAMDSSKLIDALGFNPFTPWPADDALFPTDPFWHRIRPEGEPHGWNVVEEKLMRYNERR